MKEKALNPLTGTTELCCMIVPPKYLATITGVQFIRRFGSGLTELNYIGGMQETAMINLTDPPLEFLELVEQVHKACHELKSGNRGERANLNRGVIYAKSWLHSNFTRSLCPW